MSLVVGAEVVVGVGIVLRVVDENFVGVKVGVVVDGVVVEVVVAGFVVVGVVVFLVVVVSFVVVCIEVNIGVVAVVGIIESVEILSREFILLR